MKHLIIGYGTVGKSTGKFLEANKEDVWYHDKNRRKVRDIKHTSLLPRNLEKFDMIWICTSEKVVETVIKQIPPFLRETIYIIVRSTTVPGTLDMLEKKYDIRMLIHNPEFLREKTAINDMFFTNRVVIGCNNGLGEYFVKVVYGSLHCPKIITNLKTSELIKQVANAWLATQISFWNEIKDVCDKSGVNPQEVANTVTLDKRISKYGSAMLGTGFQGKCLPKDLTNLIEYMKEVNVNPFVLHAVRNYNEGLEARRKYERNYNRAKNKKWY